MSKKFKSSNTLENVAKISKHDAEIIEALKHGFIVIDACINGKPYRTMVFKPEERTK